jgi:tRNA-specific 2-thiouridylase
MSGGIDSTVAALLLLEQGYELVGVTYRTWDSVSQGCLEKEKGCCTVDAMMEAKRMCERLGFEHHLLDLREEFRRTVVSDFVAEYLAGRTPNPCVRCNAVIKWGELLRLADQLQCAHIATGHYARIEATAEGHYLLKGVDTRKDQSYFLWQLEEQMLARTLFPLGNLTKPEVRRIALERGFEALSKKAESQEICFIPDNDYRAFLAAEVTDFAERYWSGEFVDEEGNVLGRHRGYPFYTVGQRKGLGIALGEPMYVSRIDALRNRITLAKHDRLYHQTLHATDCRFADSRYMERLVDVEARIRYKSPAVPATVCAYGTEADVLFREPVWGIAPGQSVVFYQGDRVTGGGVISA